MSSVATMTIFPALSISIPSDRLTQLQWDLDLGEWEMNRTHWALKDVDLLPVLLEAGLLDPDMLDAQPPNSRIKTIGLAQRPPDIEARPTVFRVVPSGMWLEFSVAHSPVT
jgi:hypothetical protein